MCACACACVWGGFGLRVQVLQGNGGLMVARAIELYTVQRRQVQWGGGGELLVVTGGGGGGGGGGGSGCCELVVACCNCGMWLQLSS